MAKKFDPLWEIVGEKVPLQGMEPDIDALCPNCHVRLHVGPDAHVGAALECGVCGAALEVAGEDEKLRLELRE